MNVEKVKSQLNEKYPGKQIFENTDEKGNVIEILCEVEPTSEHSEYSLAIAVADKSTPHKHLKTEESYKVTTGTLTVFVDDEKHVLDEGDELTIKPGSVHYVEGNETWFDCYSEPGWTFEDHIFIDE